MIVQDKQQLVTIIEAAETLNISAATIRFWVRTGRIMRYKQQLRRALLVDLTELRQKLTALPDPVTPPEGDEE